MGPPLLGLAVAVVHLGWEATHGGIQSHHLLAREDLPAVSNLWGLVTLPVLGLLAGYSVRHRAARNPHVVRHVVTAFVASLVLGVALSAAFLHGLGDVASGLFLAMLLAGLAVPTYRAEYLFGFVVGMAYAVGAVLPSLFATVAAVISILAHTLLHPALAALYRTLRPAR